MTLRSQKHFSGLFRKHLWNQAHVPTSLASFQASRLPFYLLFCVLFLQFLTSQTNNFTRELQEESELAKRSLGRTEKSMVWEGGLCIKEMRYFLSWSGSPIPFLVPALRERPRHHPLLSTVLTLCRSTVKALYSAGPCGLAIAFWFVSKQVVIAFPSLIWK